MIRAFALVNRRPDVSPERFREWLLVEHPRVGFRVPGLASYEISFVQADAGSHGPSTEHSSERLVKPGQGLPYDVVVELGFDFDETEDALRAWSSSSEAKSGREDTGDFTSGVTRLIVGDRMRLLHQRNRVS